MKMLISALPLVLTLAACQTVPLAETSQTSFSAPASDQIGQVRIGTFHIPKEEPGTTLLLILGAAGGADIHYPVGASIFDITGETHYLGTLSIGRAAYSQAWIEHPVPAGKRTLMLVGAPAASRIAMAPGALMQHVDFIDVDVKPGGVSHIALSRYGLARHPYLGEIQMSAANRKYCEGLTGKPGEREKSAMGYMAENGIDPYARDFKNFCRLLSDSKHIISPTEESLRQFAELKPHIESLRTKHHEKWMSEAEKRAPYDLMHSYQPISAQEF